MKKAKLLAFVFLFVFLPCVSSWAYWVWSPEQGKFVNPEGGAAQDEAEEQYSYAMRFYREKNLDESVKQLESLLKKYPSARIASEAQYRLGTIFEERGDYLKAYDAYKKLVKSYPQSDRFSEVVEREFRIGNVFLSGQKAKIMGLKILPSLSKAAEIYDHIVKNAPYSEYGDKAQFHLGLAYKKMNQFAQASEAFQGLIDQYPQSDLVSKARFELAQTSYDRSANQYRDQRALDEAARNVDRFLARYPDTDASEKALKLRQVIDEKNAEKNYRIGRYYEKKNYLNSALIYYEDIAVRYPHTKWGQKASEKLNSLQKPAEYLSGREQELVTQKKQIENKLKTIPKTDKDVRPKLEAEWKKIDEQEKSLSREKTDSLNRRKEDIKRREKELNQRFKNLAKKRKLAEDNPSEDFQRAMDRWHAALVNEKDALIREKEQLKEWHETLGIDQKKDIWDVIPFIGESPTELERVRALESKKLYKLAENKKQIFKEKESLYKQLDEVSTLLRASELEKMGLERKDSEWLETIEVTEERAAKRQKKLKEIRGNIKDLEKELDDKKSTYESRFGSSPLLSIVRVPTKIVTKSTQLVAKSLDKSFAFINPFDGKSALEGKSLEELLEYRMHLREKLAAQQNITDTLSQAFDAELALQEQRRLLEDLEKDGKVNPHDLRKAIKKIEKKIRANYQEIEDHDKTKRGLIKELNDLLQQKEAGNNPLSKSSKVVRAPARAVKAFLFGYPDEAVEVTEAAAQLSANSPVGARASKLKEEIELESLLIETKSREIVSLEKEREIMKAKASLAGGYKFRSTFVDVPYEFIGGAIKSARKLIPRKEREEILIQRLNQESKELEVLRKQLEEVDAQINKLTPGKEAPKPAQKAAPPEKAKETPVVDDKQDEMKSEIEKLMARLEAQEQRYQSEKELLEQQLASSEEVLDEQKTQREIEKEHQKVFAKRDKELRGQLERVHEDLVELIQKEDQLENQETTVLEKRISRIDQVIQTVQSKAMSQDLLHERERIENRIAQLELRRDFLSKEMERFQMSKSQAA